MVKTKWIYIIGSIIIGLVTVIGVFIALIASGVISTERYKLVLISASAQKEYDGTALVCEEWELAEGALKDGHVLEVKVLGKATDAGEYPNTFTVTIKDSVGADVTEDYEIESNYGTLHVAKKVVRVRTSSAEKVYDDSSLSSAGWELLPDSNVLEGHTLSVTTTSVASNIGVIANEASATVMAGEKDVTLNYDIQYEYGTLTIWGYPLVVTSASASKTYDGSPLTKESYTCKSQLIDGHRLEVAFDASLTEAGEIENFFIVTVYDGTEDVTRYYNVEKRMGKLKVLPRPITLRSGSAEKEYDGTPLECHEYEVVSNTTVLPNHQLSVSFAGQQLSGGTSENDFAQIVVSCYDESGNFIDVTANYDISTKLGTLKVIGGPDSDEDDDGFDEDNPGEDMQHGGGGNENGEDVIEVYSEKNARIYLRNTSYGDYDGQLFNAGVSYDQLLDDTYSYNYLFSILLKKAGVKSDTLKIHSYLEFVLPYYTEMVKEGYKTQTNDVLYTGDISSEYSVSYYQYDYIDLIKGNYFDGLTLGSYADEARAYESFVREQYLSIPDTTRAYLNTIISEQGFDINDPRLLYKVATYVQHAATYDLEYPTSLDTEDDVVISFLRDYKTGVCRHYAKAGTMLFRALGIPARYTTGFMINAKANEWTGAKVGHAWVEVYLSGLGWIQVEVTGGGSGGGGDMDWDDDPFPEPPPINPERITLQPAMVAVQYDGSNSAVPTNKLVSFPLEKQGYTYEMTATGEQSVLGKGKSTIETLRIFNADEELVYHYENSSVKLNTTAYEVELQVGVLQLYIRELTFTSHSESKMYDGTILRASGTGWEWSGLLEDGHSVGAVTFTSGTLLNVGSKANTFTVSLVDAEGQDITDWYLIKKEMGTLSILHREITVTADSQTFTYVDGTQRFACNTYRVTSEQNPDKPLAAEETITLNMTADSYTYNRGLVSNEIDVSSIKITDAEGKDITSNYIIHTQAGVLLVK